jgi:glutathione synthase/RimK-type ligase-like ATP-grasp enzyme
VIYKTLGGGLPVNRHGVRSPIYTSPVEERHFEDEATIRLTPCLFQENVSKRVELRVIAVGSELFCAEIDSQRSELTAQDWRRSYPDLRHRPHTLPSEVERGLRELMDRLGLLFGAIDLILTPDGRYVFLEINANGQWAWLEGELGMPLTSALVDLLTR